MDVSSVKSAMEATNARFCNEVIGQGQMDALAGVYTPDAKILPPGAPMISGLEHIKGFWQQAIAALGITGAKLTSFEVEMCGDSAIEIGQAELHLKTGESAAAKYIVHWKQRDGQWLWDKDIWNM